MHHMITDWHNFDSGYIALVDLDLGDLPTTIDVAGETFFRKKEFHISLVCTKRLADMVDPNRKQEIEADMVERFKKYVEHTPLSNYTLLPELRIGHHKDGRKSIIIMANVPGLEGYFDELRQAYGKELPLQPMHVTLYTVPESRGIGFLSQQEIDDHTDPVALPELVEKIIR